MEDKITYTCKQVMVSVMFRVRSPVGQMVGLC